MLCFLVNRGYRQIQRLEPGALSNLQLNEYALSFASRNTASDHFDTLLRTSVVDGDVG